MEWPGIREYMKEGLKGREGETVEVNKKNLYNVGKGGNEGRASKHSREMKMFSVACCSLSPVRPEVREMTSLGAAVAAGLAQGVWSDSAHLPTLQSSTFQPSISPDSESLPLTYFLPRLYTDL